MDRLSSEEVAKKCGLKELQGMLQLLVRREWKTEC